MHDPNDRELTAAEREAFDALPREMMPSRMLEERIVTELRARGLLGARRASRLAWTWERVPLVAAAASGIALFACGLALGQWLGARHTADAMLALQRQEDQSILDGVKKRYSSLMSRLFCGNRPLSWGTSVSSIPSGSSASGPSGCCEPWPL